GLRDARLPRGLGVVPGADHVALSRDALAASKYHSVVQSYTGSITGTATKGDGDEVGCARSVGGDGGRRVRPARDLADAWRHAAASRGGQPDPAAADPEPFPPGRRRTRGL